MLELGAPLALLGLPPAIALVWWLHRLHAPTERVAVEALFLWRAAAQRASHGAKRARRTDPIWPLRAAIAGLIAVALAAPALRERGARVVVWFDDSLSMHALEAGAPRSSLARDALLAALDDADARAVLVRSLGDPARALALSSSSAARHTALDEWLAQAAPVEPEWPSRVELTRDAEHWLVTDGADADAAAWLATAPVARVLRVGERTDNTAVTRLAARRSLAADDAWLALVEVANTDAVPVMRTVELTIDGVAAQRLSVTLPPGASAQLDFGLPAGTGALGARVLGDDAPGSGDALPADDALELALPAARVSARIEGACPPALRAALASHPRLTLAAAAADLVIVCSDERPVAAVPTLWFRSSGTAQAQEYAAPALPVWSPIAPRDLSALFLEPAWLALAAPPAAAGDVWLHAGDAPAILRNAGEPPLVHVLLDAGLERLVQRPEYPALIAGLVHAVHPGTALDSQVSTERAAAASRIAPRALPAAAQIAPVTTTHPLDLRPWLLGAAALLLLVDALLLARGLRGSAGRRRAFTPAIVSRVALGAALAVAAVPPAFLTRDAPHDLIVLWDDSASMTEVELGAASASLAHVAAALPNDSRAAVVRFGRDTVLEAASTEGLASLAAGQPPPRTQPLDRSGSNLDAALRLALRSAEPDRPTAIAIVSDGRVGGAAVSAGAHPRLEPGSLGGPYSSDPGSDSSSPTPFSLLLQRARAAGLPVYALQPPPAPGATLTIRVPEHAAAGQPVPVDVALHAPTPLDGTLTVAVDDAVHASLPVELDGVRPLDARFDVLADAGRRSVRVAFRGRGERIEREQALYVEGETPWLLVTREAGGAAASALAAGGWPLRFASPAELPAYAARWGELAGVVLDDLAMADLAASSGSALARAVRELGLTLVVLGGPRSFGAGGYRHSWLEELLPVTAEAADPRAVSAVLFVIDASGSMAKSSGRVSPMSYAQRAVLETARTLGPRDAIGLTAFDIAARTVLPLGSYPEPVAALDGAFGALGPAGGTRLRPALQQAFATLAATPLERRLLVLVTDGFVANEDLEAPLAALESQGTEILALAVGRDADTIALRKLVGAENLFRVEHASELPELMRSAVEERRQPRHEGATPVRVRTPLPGTEAVELPAVGGFMRTRAKPTAAVYVEALSGEPVLAVQHAGAGRVAALPAGLGAWAAAWTHGPEWPAFGRALDRWLASRGASADLHVRIEDGGAAPQLLVDALDDGGEWSAARTATARLTNPAGATTELALPRVAPGRFAAPLPAGGVATLTIEHGSQRSTHAGHGAVRPGGETLGAPDHFPELIARGLLAAAPPRAAEWRFSAAASPAPPAAWITPVLLAAFLLSLAQPHLRAAHGALAGRRGALAASLRGVLSGRLGTLPLRADPAATTERAR